MLFPDESVLLARGKYSTLSRARKSQVERFQKAGQTAMHSIAAALKECQDMPPSDVSHLTMVRKCLENMEAARQEIVELCVEIIPLKAEAWE